jgi:hypothetical protein
MKYQWDDRRKKDEMGCACAINRGKKKRIHSLNLNLSCHGGEN